uniref:Uncharacterized protein n=1 Tax=Arundo donax TaxID=35708 RepID=A0A0A9G7L1_ARUDO
MEERSRGRSRAMTFMTSSVAAAFLKYVTPPRPISPDKHDNITCACRHRRCSDSRRQARYPACKSSTLSATDCAYCLNGQTANC